MSSCPFDVGLPIYDDVPAFLEDSFILRAKDRKSMFHLVNKLVQLTPRSKDVLVCHIGLRPDHPIPRAMYFVEIGTRDHIVGGTAEILWGWVNAIQGKAIDERQAIQWR